MRRGEGPKRESNLGSDPVWVAGKGGGGGVRVSLGPFPPKKGRQSRYLSRGKAEDGQ